jgi:hypothetical protein
MQDCLEAFDQGIPVCGSSLELLRTTVSTLIGISGAHRSRVHRQYSTYRALAHDLRVKLYDSCAATATSRGNSLRASMACSRRECGPNCAAADAAAAAAAAPASLARTSAASAGSAHAARAGVGARLWRLLRSLSLTRASGSSPRHPESLPNDDSEGALPPPCSPCAAHAASARCTLRVVSGMPIWPRGGPARAVIT